VDRRPVAAAPLVHEAIELNKGLADEKRIRIDAKTPSRLPTISADRERVLQVFGNLLGNAIKFTPTGGQVTVAADHSDRSARFMVADNGPGITPEQQGKLFVPFWQSKPDGRVGAGLGLSICKAIVEAHGGRIWVESHAGRGTAFYFTVPLASAREEERQPSSGDAADEDEDHHD
jgi:signal transduction histidine kinase